jgi:hypothetical protein
MHVLRFLLTYLSSGPCMCGSTASPSCAHPAPATSLPTSHFLPTLLPLFAASHPRLISLSRVHSQTSYDLNCRANPIAHRVRRKRQRLPPSLLIENASDQHLSNPKCLLEAFPIKASDKPGVTLSKSALASGC